MRRPRYAAPRAGSHTRAPRPMPRVESATREAAASLSRDGSCFAEAILTTDTHTKEAVATVQIGGETVTIGGVAKGSGMIHPNMATMLAFVTTDAAGEEEWPQRGRTEGAAGAVPSGGVAKGSGMIHPNRATMLAFVTTDAAVEKKCLQSVLTKVTARTFNRVSVDGDTSPNDMVLLMANGAAGNETLTQGSENLAVFESTVEVVMRELAKEIARDGEGATKLVEVIVEGAESEEKAATLARAVVG